MKPIDKKIVQVARSYVGQEEIRGNVGFKDSEFGRKMSAVGFESGYAWCALFGELVWKEAYQLWNAFYVPILDKLFSAGAVKTYNNFKADKRFKTGQVPKEGALVVWQKYIDGKPHWTGHVGIVTEIMEGGYFKSVEGNTNLEGQREGVAVMEKVRYVTKTKAKKGLVIKGFVYPTDKDLNS